MIDDPIAYYVSDDEIFLVPNAANTPAVVAARAAAPQGISVTDQHRSHAVLAVRGPGRPTCWARWDCRPTWTTCEYADASYSGVLVVACRTGYTGEHGYELLPPWDAAPVVFDALVTEVGRRRSAVPGWARGTPCAPRWAIRCTATSCRWISRCRPAAAGPSAGSKDAFWGREALLAEKAAGPRRLLPRVCGRWAAVC